MPSVLGGGVRQRQRRASGLARELYGQQAIAQAGMFRAATFVAANGHDDGQARQGSDWCHNVPKESLVLHLWIGYGALECPVGRQTADVRAQTVSLTVVVQRIGRVGTKEDSWSAPARMLWEDAESVPHKDLRRWTSHTSGLMDIEMGRGCA